jgi:hypothetical protein
LKLFLILLNRNYDILIGPMLLFLLFSAFSYVFIREILDIRRKRKGALK